MVNLWLWCNTDVWLPRGDIGNLEAFREESNCVIIRNTWQYHTVFSILQGYQIILQSTTLFVVYVYTTCTHIPVGWSCNFLVGSQLKGIQYTNNFTRKGKITITILQTKSFLFSVSGQWNLIIIAYTVQDNLLVRN